MTKDDAQKLALERWRKLPLMERQTHKQAQVFAASLADELDFRTMGNERKVIAAWLIRDIEKTKEATAELDAREQQHHAEAEDGKSAA
ncbi:MAG: hypothetical protein EOP22_17580 [Hyphomicrobiales bacterium]|nr:MAG: hypothetical protein EOP22_17580 [Hyphomicrobiales bacterium]